MAANIPQVAQRQRWLLLVILAYILLIIGFGFAVASGKPDVAATLRLVMAPVAIASLILLILLMIAMDRPVVSIVLAGIAQFIPLVGLIVLLVVNSRATAMLRAAGYRVGLLGASGK
jgi:hypothetical protein